MSTLENNNNISDDLVKQSKLTQARKDSIKRYVAKNPEKISEIKKRYYIKQKKKN